MRPARRCAQRRHRSIRASACVSFDPLKRYGFVDRSDTGCGDVRAGDAGLTTALHYEGLKLLAIPRRESIWRSGPAFASTLLVALHLAEIGLYAAAYAVGVNALDLGALHGAVAASGLDCFYFAAETYLTLGYGDVVPTGALRLVASVEPLNGLLLLAWTVAFLFRHLDVWDERRADRT